MLQKTGVATLTIPTGHASGTARGLSIREERGCIVPESVEIWLDKERLIPSHFDKNGNPLFGGVAGEYLTWKLRQLAIHGVIKNTNSAQVKYSYALTGGIEIPIQDRLPKPYVCPICNKMLRAEQLEGSGVWLEVGGGQEDYFPGIDLIDSKYVDVVAHKDCAYEFEHARIVDEITRCVESAFRGIGNELRWCQDLSYDLIRNEYNSSGHTWFMFHTPYGDVKVGWCTRVLEITWTSEYARRFSPSIFNGENVTKGQRAVKENGRLQEYYIHARSYGQMREFLARAHEAACST